MMVYECRSLARLEDHDGRLGVSAARLCPVLRSRRSLSHKCGAKIAGSSGDRSTLRRHTGSQLLIRFEARVWGSWCACAVSLNIISIVVSNYS